MLGMKGRGYELWWSGKGDGVGGVVLGEGGTALEGGGGKKCKCYSY